MASPLADFVVSLGTDGCIASQGNISEALAKNKKLLEETEREEEAIDLDEQEDLNENTDKDAAAKLVLEEEVEIGHVSTSSCERQRSLVSFRRSLICLPVMLFFDALGGKIPALFWCQYLTSSMMAQVFDSLEMWWLGYWASQYTLYHPSEISVP